MKKKIAIIGAGVGGLTLANLLGKDPNFELMIYEREETLRLDEGFGVQLAVNSVSILNEIGFDKISQTEIFNPQRLEFYSNDKRICSLDLTQFNIDSEKYTTLKRSTLLKFLKDKLFSNIFRFNKSLEKIETINDKIKIRFTDGIEDEVDYLVVSDGVFSKTKSLIEGKDYSPSYIGSKAFRITIPKDKVKVFDSNNINISMKPNAHLVIYPINQKTCNVVMITRCNTALSKKLEDISFAKSFIKKIFNLSSEFDEYINDDLKHWSLYSSKNPVLPKINNVFYLGDAFYTFLPSMAQGAAQSIEAAKELFEILNNTNKNKSEEYFNQRAERTKLINSRSNFNYFAFHFSNTLFVYFRNLILKRLIKNSKFVDSYLGRVFRK